MADDQFSQQGLKFKLAREHVRVPQHKAATASGTTQTIISMLERLDKKQVSISYLKFLFKNGIDLNVLFDEDISAEDYENLLRNNDQITPIKKIAKLEDMVLKLQEQLNEQKRK